MKLVDTDKMPRGFIKKEYERGNSHSFKVVDAYLKYLGKTIRFYVTTYKDERGIRLDQALYKDTFGQKKSEWLMREVRESMMPYFGLITGFDPGEVHGGRTNENEYTDEEIEEIKEDQREMWAG